MANFPVTNPYREQETRSSVKSSYQPHLDGLRALAIFGVLFEHFGLILPPLLRYGPLGVRFFFVLSGYFITLSLWRLQASVAEAGGGSLGHLLRFYLGRLMRIGPPFYLALLVGVALGIPEVRTNLLWLATFQTNNYVAHLGYWPNSIAHYWSLALQEQFYLLWPFVVLTLPKRWFLPVMAAFIVFGLGFRVACIVTNTSPIIRWVSLFGCIDSFAVGALVAYLKETRLLEKMKLFSSTMLSALPLIAFGCYFLARATMVLPFDNVCLALTESLDGVFLMWLLAVSVRGVRGPYRTFLCWAPLVYLGRISYGIYVYHVFILILFMPVLASWGLVTGAGSYFGLAILFVLTVTLASLSWHWLEMPFIAWKNSLSVPREEAPLPARALSLAK